MGPSTSLRCRLDAARASLVRDAVRGPGMTRKHQFFRENSLPVPARVLYKLSRVDARLEVKRGVGLTGFGWLISGCSKRFASGSGPAGQVLR